MSKLTDINNIIKCFHDEGYTILHHEANCNINSKITAINNENNLIIYTTYKIFRKSKRGYYFHQRNPYTIYNIKTWLLNNRKNIKLLSEEYIGSVSNMKFYDTITDRIFYTSWNSISSKGNNYDLTKRKFMTYDELYEFFNKNGYKLLISKENYNGNSYDYECTTNDGYKVMCNYFRIAKNVTPSIFNRNNPHAIYNVKLWLSKTFNNIKLISDTFEGWNKDLILLNTDSNTLFKCTFHNLWSDRGGYNNISHKSHKVWSKNVYSEYDYKCAITGVSIMLNAHHIYNWKDNEELRFDINNGLCMSKPIHILFHKIYGNNNNNEEQIYDFCDRFYNNEFDNMIIMNKTVSEWKTLD